MAMGKNLDKNININELKAQAEKKRQDAELELQRVEQLQQEQKEAEKQQKIDERQALLDNVATFMAQSRQEALAGNLTKAETLKGFAEDAKKLANEIQIDGEELEDEVVELPTEPFFGKGYSVARRWILTTLFTLALFAISSYLNHLVKLEGTDISMAVRSAWIDFIIKLNHWSIMWLIVDVSLLINWSVVYRFRNNHEAPEHNLISKWFLNCSDEFQVKQALYLVYAKAFSFAIMYLASPITNS